MKNKKYNHEWVEKNHYTFESKGKTVHSDHLFRCLKCKKGKLVEDNVDHINDNNVIEGGEGGGGERVVITAKGVETCPTCNKVKDIYGI